MGKSLHKFFAALTGHERMLPWQQELLEEWLLPGRLPQAVDIPTGLGKTSVMALWLLALAAQMKDGGKPELPRRLIYVVDRRAVVDQATAEAEKLRENLANEDALAWMRRAFRLADGEGLPVSTLRGQLADNRQWLADPAMPGIVVGTVDMIGSRLLFSGYGVGEGMRPYHAGLLGVDALVLLDEAHLVPAFQRLLEGIAGVRDASPWHTGVLWPEREIIKPLKVVPLSATQVDAGGGEEVFTLSAKAAEDKMTRQRLFARKTLELRAFDPGRKEDDALTEALARVARELLDDGAGGLRPRRLLIYCDRRKVAERLHGQLKDEWGEKTRGRDKRPRLADIELFTGARRVFERAQAAECLEELGFIAAGERAKRDKPAILIATSAAEVGVDLDADDCICDLVPLERMIQRFGRVNRRGERDDTRMIVLHPEPLPKKGPHAEQLPDVLRALRMLHGDASPQALRELAMRERELVKRASTPPPLHPPLTLPVVESWALTNLKEHTGRPDIQPWLRGWEEDDQPQAEIIWRKYLPWPEGGGPRKDDVNAFFDAARPHLLEVLETDAENIARTLVAQAKKWAGEGLGIFLLNHRNECEKYFSMEELAAMQPSELRGQIAFRRVVAPAALGGLDKDGLLASGTTEPVVALDATEEEQWQRAVGFRVRKRKKGEESKEPDWKVAHTWQERETDEAEEQDTERLVVEVYRGADARGYDGDPAIARQRQELLEHLQWVRKEAEALAERLGLPDELKRPLRLAAWLHDMGKRRRLWQRVMARNPQMKRLWAKTPHGGNGHLLGGFRHEFASVLDVLNDGGVLNAPDDVKAALASIRAEMAALAGWQRDLALHLVAAHHGRARPLMPPIDEELPPSRLEREVRNIALRFARMQKRFGPWGLAWLEALLRAADQRASRRLDMRAAADDGGRAGEMATPEAMEAAHG